MTGLQHEPPTQARRVLRRTLAAPLGPVVARSVLGPVIAVGDGSDDLRVEVVIDAAPDAADAVRLEVEATPTGVRVSLDSTVPTWRGWAELRVTVPRDATYDVSAVAGDVRLAGLGGSGRARSQSGAIEATDLSGDCDLGTVSGAVSVRGGLLAFEVETVSGAIEIVATPAAPSSARSTAGSIRLELTGPARVDTTSLMGGHTLSGAGTAVTLSSTAGAIEVSRQGG